MSGAPQLRRGDRVMSEAEMKEALTRGYCGRVTTVGEDGWPYCVPLLYVWIDGRIHVHGTSAQGHLRSNVAHSDKACFEIDEAGEVFPYGRFECDTTLAYSSVVAFGRIRIVDDTPEKQRFFDAFMAKYARPEWVRPKGFYPRLDAITLYAIDIERMTGKRLALPDATQRWPAKDRTTTPNARP